MHQSRRFLLGLAVLVFLAAFAPALSSTKTDSQTPPVAPLWTLDFETRVAWQRVTPLGHLVIAAPTGMFGVDPVAGEVIWRQTGLGHMPEEGFQLVPGTPLIVLAEDTEDENARVVILDSIRGVVVFDSAKAGVVRMLSHHVMFESGGLLVMGFLEGKPRTTLFMFDIATGERRWMNDEITGRPGKMASTLASMFQAVTGESGVSAEPIEVDGDGFLFITSSAVFKIASRTGEIVWKVNDFPGMRPLVALSPGDVDRFLIGCEANVGSNPETQTAYAFYTAYRLSDGEAVWDKPIRVKGGVNHPIFTDRGVLVGSSTTAKGRLKLVDPETGRSLWKKPLKLQGGVVDHDFLNDGIVVTTGHDNAWTNKGTEYFLNVLDVGAAALRYKSSLKVKGRMLHTEVLPRGVLYITTNEINFFDPATGKPVFKKSVRSKSPLVTALDGDVLYAFSADEGALYAVDRPRGTIRKLSQQAIRLQGKDEPRSLEVRDDGIVLISDQNIVSFTREGATRFHAYHPAPRRSALMRALLTANAVRAAMASAATGVNAAAFASASSAQEPGSANEVITAGAADAYAQMAEGYAGLSGDYMKAARQRFKASADATDSVFMMVDGGSKGFGLARVSKTTGEVLAVVDMRKDRQPSYQVDGISERIYYRRSDNEIVCYAF